MNATPWQTRTWDDTEKYIAIPTVRLWIEPWAYIIVLGGVELVSDLCNSILGGWLHVFLAAWLVGRASMMDDQNRAKFIRFLSVTPLIRVISTALSIHIFTGVYYYALAEALILTTATAFAWKANLTMGEIGVALPKRGWVLPFLILSGVMAGWGEFRWIQPTSVVAGLQFSQIWLPALLLFVFTGFVEELVFRGMMFALARRFCGSFATILFTTIAWTLLHMGWRSWEDLLLVFVTGMFWGWMRQYSKSVIPVATAHGVANIVIFIILPNLH